MLGLIFLLIMVLFLPFTVKTVERNLEGFLFIMGLMAAFMSGIIDKELLMKVIEDPLHIVLAVLIAGLLFRWLQTPIERGIIKMSTAMPFRIFLAFVVIFLGILSSIITAIIAALVLVAITSVLKLDRKSEIHFVILACFSIGMGAALTPIGEPLSTIATSKLNEHFFFLFHLIGPDVIPAVLLFGIVTAVLIRPKRRSNKSTQHLEIESYGEIFIRSFKVYIFVMALTLLGAGVEPLIEKYILNVNPLVLYWMNMISAVLDNATLAAAEISPAMDGPTIKAILLGLLISGGMLIPGNIPNIIVAGKLNITSLEWARFGVPVGLIAMVIYFFVILLLG